MENDMNNLKVRALLAIAIAWVGAVPVARAQWAVVDAPAILQLIQEVQTAAQQLATARNQLLQAQQALQTMTGGRGMEQLLGTTVRNYLPSDWSQVSAVLQGSGGYSALAADTQSIVNSNSVLSAQRMATLSASGQQLIQAQRQWGAMQQALAHQALGNASSRFAAIQSLISSIASAADQKAILDLQARINAELGMLQNEQTKNQLLSQSALAQESSLRQQAREQVIEGHGRFETRFQPVP
jgi:type IV secretion system protein VirB5